MVNTGIVTLLKLLHVIGAAAFEECRYTYTDSQGEFRTPDSNQDGYYDNGLTCDWTIITEQGKLIWLFILEFDVQTDDQCIYDNLKVYDGFDEYSPLFGTYCGDMRVNESCIPPKIRSSSNGLHIQFHSDDRTTAGGVRAVFVSAEERLKDSAECKYNCVTSVDVRHEIKRRKVSQGMTDFSSLGNSWRRWPQGKYSIPMSIYGCPDQELNNWSHGSYNITISTDYTYDLEGVNETGSKFLWDKSDLLLLGPFGTNTFQINFCTRDKSASAPDTKHLYEDESGQRIYLELAEWPRGDYGIFNANVMLSELYQFEPDDTEEIQCPKGFLNKQLKLHAIDSYVKYGQAPTSLFNCSTEYHVGNSKIKNCDLTFYTCMKHFRDPDVDRVEDLRLPFMVLVNVLDFCQIFYDGYNLTSRLTFLGEKTSMKVVWQIVYPSTYLKLSAMSPGPPVLYEESYTMYCFYWFPMFAVVPKDTRRLYEDQKEKHGSQPIYSWALGQPFLIRTGDSEWLLYDLSHIVVVWGLRFILRSEAWDDTLLQIDDVPTIMLSNQKWAFLNHGAIHCLPRHEKNGSRTDVYCVNDMTSRSARYIALHDKQFTLGTESVTGLHYSIWILSDRDSERCHQNLGIEDGYIEDFQISQAKRILVPDSEGGLGNYGWCTTGTNSTLSITFHLYIFTVIEGVIIHRLTPGCPDRKMQIAFESDVDRFFDTKYETIQAIGVGEYTFARPVITNTFKITINSVSGIWTHDECFKIELIGCRNINVKHIQRKRNRQCYTEYKSNAPRILIDYFYNGFGERDSHMRHCSAAMITPYGMCYWRSSSPSFSYGVLQPEFPAELYIEICPPNIVHKALLYPKVDSQLTEITTVVRKPGIITNLDYPFHYSSGELWCWKIFFNSSVTINMILYNVSLNRNQVFLQMGKSDVLPWDIQNLILKSLARFSDNKDRLYIANSEFDPINIFSDKLLWKAAGLLQTLDKSMNGRMGYYMTQSNMVRLFWRTVSPFDRPAADMSTAGFRLLAYPATGKHVCNSEANCTWNDAIVMSETVMIDIEMDKELIQNWNIHVQIKRFIFLRFAMFDIGCQSGSVLELEFSSTDTHSLCNTNKPIVGLNSTSNILKITFTFQKRPNRVIEGFKADYIARKIPRLSPSLITHEEQVNVLYGVTSGQVTSKVCSKLFKKCYILLDLRKLINDVKATWTFVDTQVCSHHNWSLISLHSKLEQDFVSNLLQDRFDIDGIIYVYIGLWKSVDGRSEYQWSNGSPMTYTSWANNHPSSDQGRCSMMRLRFSETSTWESISCYEPRAAMAVCQYDWTESTTTKGPRRRDIEKKEKQVQAGEFSKYLLDVYICRNGEVVSLLGRCNNATDCFDHSDEENCMDTTESCGVNQFRCGDGRCVSISVMCDHIPDCANNEDENCDFPLCDQSTEFTCHEDKKCLPLSKRCDGKVDCFDRTDEDNCVADQCNNGNAFLCADAYCISNEFVCDGIKDCISGTDELGCYYPDSCQALWDAGYQTSGIYDIVGGEVECDFTSVTTDKKIITRVHNIDYGRVITTDAKQLFVYPDKAALQRLIQDESCYQTVHQLCQPWAHRLYEIDKKHEQQWKAKSYIHACHCLQYRKLLTTNQTTFTFTNDEVLDCEEVRSFPNQTFHLAFEHSPADGTIQSMILKKNHIIEVSQLKVDVRPIICQADFRHVKVGFACGHGATTAAETQCLYKQDVFGHIVGCRSLKHLQNCDDFVCPVNYFKCPESFCIEKQYVCDGTTQCGYGEDEKDCESRTCTSEFRCLDSSVCLPIHYICDGYPQCPEGDDERLCNYTCPNGCSCIGFAVNCQNIDSSFHEQINVPLFTRMIDISGNNEAYSGITWNVSYSYLIHLNMSSCGIRYISPPVLQNMKNLIVLDLTWNNLASLPSHLFISQSRLQILRLSNNRELITIQPDAFVGLTSIKHLSINHLNIERILQNAFASLNLVSLDLSDSYIKTLEDSAFATLTADNIFLNNTKISKFSTELFKGIEYINFLVTDSVKFCCIKPYFLTEDRCFPHENEISSCDDLLRNEVLRPFAWVIGLTSFISNVLAFVYRMYDKERLKLGYGIFVSNLAISDFLLGVYLIIIASADVYYRGNYMMNDDLWRTGWLCNLAGVISTFSSEASVFFICLITIDRLLVVKYPFGEVRMRPRPSWVISAIVWSVCLFLSLVPIIFITYFRGEFYSRSSVCLGLPLTSDKPAGWLYSVCIFICINFVLFLLIAGGQWLIFREVTNASDKVVAKGRDSRQKELRVARNLLLVAMTDFMCWFPVGVLGVLALGGVAISGEVYSWITVFVLPINSALNPFLYTLMTTVKKGAMLPAADEQVQTLTFPKAKIEELSTVWKDVRLTMNIKAIGLPSGYQTLAGLLERKALTLRQGVEVGKEILNIVYNLHSRELVQKDLVIDDVFVKLSMSAKEKMQMKVMLDARTQLGYMHKTKAENIKSFGDILNQILESNARLSERV